MAILKLNTTYNRTFLLVQSADHVTGLTGASPTVSLSKNTGAFAGNHGGSGGIHEIANGWYWVVLDSTDLNTAGDLAYHITAASGDPTDFTDQVQQQIFTDLTLDASGNVSIASSYKKNAAIPFFSFPMTVNGVPTPGLTVTCQRDLGGGFAPCNQVTATERSNGIYFTNLAATDTNAATGIFRFTAPGADDRDILLFFQP